MPRPTTPDPLCTTLRNLRQARGTTQGQIAHAAGVDRTSLTGWESGRIHPPLHRVRAWAAALGYDLVLSYRGVAPRPTRYEQLIAERDRLILAGANPDELAIPIPPLTEPTP